MPDPNVLVIISDDQRYDTLDYMPFVKTGFQEQGRLFTRAYTDVGICQPARVGFLSGQLAKTHGTYTNTATPLVNENDLLAKWLDDRGYRTGMLGKYLNSRNGTEAVPTGWDTWKKIIQSSSDEYGFDVWDGSSTTTISQYQTDYLLAQAQTFIGGTEPWFLSLAPTLPHVLYEPSVANAFRYSHVLRSFTPQDVTDKPSWITGLPALDAADYNQLRANWRGMLRELIAVDEMIQALFASIDLTDTYVFFTSDNGVNLGENRRTSANSKGDPYDHIHNVPHVVAGPDFTFGTSSEPVMALQDITKTILAVSGATAGLTQAGADLRDVQNNGGSYTSRQLLIQQRNDVDGVIPDHDAVVTSTRKLIRYLGATPPSTYSYEAYDLDTDPYELTNWAGDAGRSSERATLETALDALLA